jgi:hypothetical protein
MADLKSPRMIYLKGCFARFFYFAFYVIGHYVDPGCGFAGLGSFALYLWRRRPTPLLRIVTGLF